MIAFTSSDRLSVSDARKMKIFVSSRYRIWNQSRMLLSWISMLPLYRCAASHVLLTLLGALLTSEYVLASIVFIVLTCAKLGSLFRNCKFLGRKVVNNWKIH